VRLWQKMMHMIIYFLYDLILFLATPVIIGFHLYRSLKRGRHAALVERFGSLKNAERAKIAGYDTIWVHAVSVGETIAAKSLLKSLKERFPEKKIVLSSVTETGRSIAVKLEEVDLCIYFPFDYGFAVRKTLSAINPSCIIIVETEIWPNFLRFAGYRKIPVILVNGRISDRSFKKYKQFRWLFRRFLANISAFCMQSEEDARRIIEIGAPPGRVNNAKNLKYDIILSRFSPEKCREMREEYHIPPEISVLTAGSTHQGEEEIVINAYNTLIHENRKLLLVLAPRHPERAAKVIEILQRQGVSCTLRSDLDERSGTLRNGEVLLLDTVGELMRFYALSDLVFVGGSLVPVGGHNVLEPSSLRKPVLFGPHMSNFKEIVSLVLKYGGGVQVADGRELEAAVRSLLDDEMKRNEIGSNGKKLLEENSGATKRHMEIIASFLGG
jgi:3-deoxy-D-manno-octulosonic-acid transferase